MTLPSNVALAAVLKLADEEAAAEQDNQEDGGGQEKKHGEAVEQHGTEKGRDGTEDVGGRRCCTLRF